MDTRNYYNARDSLKLDEVEEKKSQEKKGEGGITPSEIRKIVREELKRTSKPEPEKGKSEKPEPEKEKPEKEENEKGEESEESEESEGE